MHGDEQLVTAVDPPAMPPGFLRSLWDEHDDASHTFLERILQVQQVDKKVTIIDAGDGAPRKKHFRKELVIRKRLYTVNLPMCLKVDAEEAIQTQKRRDAEAKHFEEREKEAEAHSESAIDDVGKLPVLLCFHGTDETVWDTDLLKQKDGRQVLLDASEGYSWVCRESSPKSPSGPEPRLDEYRQHDPQPFILVFGQASCHEARNWETVSWRKDSLRSEWMTGENDLL